MCNTLALFNSQLLKAYTSFDPRVRQLCFVIKHWAKRRCIADPYRGSPSSYAWVLLVINYLQASPSPRYHYGALD
jgi:DNA polymerase sigma